MAIIDFIDVIDDIIDLSSDDENVEQGHIASQPPEMMLDRQEVFVEAADVRQEAGESGNTMQATTWSMFKKEGPLGTTATQNCPPMAVPFPSPTLADPKANPSLQPDQIEKRPSTRSTNYMTSTTPFSVAEKGPLGTTATQNSPPTAVPFPSPIWMTPKALTFEEGNGMLLYGRRPRKKKNLTFEGGNGMLLYGRRPRKKKNYHTETPRRSPRLEKGSRKLL